MVRFGQFHIRHKFSYISNQRFAIDLDRSASIFHPERSCLHICLLSGFIRSHNRNRHCFRINHHQNVFRRSNRYQDSPVHPKPVFLQVDGQCRFQELRFHVPILLPLFRLCSFLLVNADLLLSERQTHSVR